MRGCSRSRNRRSPEGDIDATTIRKLKRADVEGIGKGMLADRPVSGAIPVATDIGRRAGHADNRRPHNFFGGGLQHGRHPRVYRTRQPAIGRDRRTQKYTRLPRSAQLDRSCRPALPRFHRRGRCKSKSWRLQRCLANSRCICNFLLGPHRSNVARDHHTAAVLLLGLIRFY